MKIKKSSYNKKIFKGSAFALPLILVFLIIISSFAVIVVWNARKSHELLHSQFINQKNELNLIGISNILIYLDPIKTNQIYPDGHIHEVSYNGEKYQFTLQAASGLVDINYANNETLYNLFQILGANRNLATKLTQEIQSYHRYKSTDNFKPFRNINELNNITGISTTSLSCIKQYVTVDSGLAQPYALYSPAQIKKIGSSNNNLSADNNNQSIIQGSGYILSVKPSKSGINKQVKLVFRKTYDTNYKIIYHEISFNDFYITPENQKCF